MSSPVLSKSIEELLPIISSKISGHFETPPIAITTHSVVFKAYSQIHQRFVAVKIINQKAIPQSIIEKFLTRELDITQKVRHPHLARCLSISKPSTTKIVIISDYYDRGTLLDLVLREKKIKEFPIAITLFRQLIEAINYLHIRGIAHRDIKLENIMIDGNGDVKLIDFGFARHIQRRERSRSFCGTQPYVSPNISKYKPYDAFAADYYASGVILYSMVVGKWPEKNVSSHELFGENAPSTSCRKLINSLLEEDEICRAGYDECVNSEWMGQQPTWVFANHVYFYEKVNNPIFQK